MTSPVQAITAVVGEVGPSGAARPVAYAHHASFYSFISDGIDKVDQKLINADRLARAFALDDSVPVHQVTLAIEEASMSFQMLMQIRTHLVEAYQQIYQMQL